MDERPDRDKFVELLNQLGEAEDEKVLTAARALHAAIQDSGMSWDELLIPDDEDLDDDDFDDGEDEADEEEDVIPATDAGDSAALIDKLLANKEISEALRDELEGYKEDIAEGDFTSSDAAYLNSLEKRLGKG